MECLLLALNSGCLGSPLRPLWEVLRTYFDGSNAWDWARMTQLRHWLPNLL
jgi:hypothetical protein